MVTSSLYKGYASLRRKPEVCLGLFPVNSNYRGEKCYRISCLFLGGKATGLIKMHALIGKASCHCHIMQIWEEHWCGKGTLREGHVLGKYGQKKFYTKSSEVL